MNKQNSYFYRREKSLKAIKNRIDVEIREFAANDLKFDELEEARRLINQTAKKMDIMGTPTVATNHPAQDKG